MRNQYFTFLHLRLSVLLPIWMLLHFPLMMLPTAAANTPAKSVDLGLLPEPEGSVLKLEGRSICATGFVVAPRTIATAMHVATTLCGPRSCPELTIASPTSSSSKARKLSCAAPSIRLVAPAFDLAFLTVDCSPPLESPVAFASSFRVHRKAIVAGYPGCGALSTSQGTIEAQTSLTFDISAPGMHGYSGAPVFDSERNVIGMVTHGQLDFQALLKKIVGADYGQTITAAPLIHSLLQFSGNEAFEVQLRVLSDFYRQHVRTATGADRLTRSLEFLRMVEKLISYLPQDHVLLYPGRSLFLGERTLGLLPRLPSSGDSAAASHAEFLSVAYALETRGARDHRLKPVLPSAFAAALAASGRNPAHVARLEEAVATVREQRYDGVYLETFERYKLHLAALLAAACLWVWSLGYVFAAARGNFLKRAAVMAAVGILFWPLSFAWFVIVKVRELKSEKCSETPESSSSLDSDTG